MENSDSCLVFAAHIRALNLFYHHSHHLVSGPSFGSDHALFSAFYTELNANYDSVSEGIVSCLGAEAFDFRKLIEYTEEIIETLGLLDFSSNENMFLKALEAENVLASMCESFEKQDFVSFGLKTLLADLAYASEVRRYKIKRRLNIDY